MNYHLVKLYIRIIKDLHQTQQNLSIIEIMKMPALNLVLGICAKHMQCYYLPDEQNNLKSNLKMIIKLKICCMMVCNMHTQSSSSVDASLNRKKICVH